MKKPTISIITACFNSEDTIKETLDSLRAQSHPFEHIIVDGGSQDRTLEIVDSYSDIATKVISEPDKGMYDALNKGIGLASGDIIGFLHADDYYPHAEVLNLIAQEFHSPETMACYGDLNYVKRYELNHVVRYWKAGEYNYRKFYWGWMPPHPTVFLRRELYHQFGPFSLEMGSAADYEMMLRVFLKHRVKPVYVPKVLVHMRCGGMSNLSLKNRLRAHKNDRLAWHKNGLTPYPWTITFKPLRKLSQFLFKKHA